MKSFSNFGPFSACLLAALTFSSGNAGAQDQNAGELDEIVVTASKREQTLQDVPVAVTVTSAATIQKASIQDVMDLATIVPSLRVSQLQTSTQTNFLIRGFGNGANNPGIESSVGVFIDGVYRSRSASQIGDLVDVQRVEVLRGPQSTLFGQNASAGVISVTTQKPSFTFGGNAEATIGNYSENIFKGKVTGPISDKIAFSLTGSRNKRDGYFSELNNGLKINDRDRWDLRGQLLWNATDNLSVRLIADKSKIDEICCGVVNLVNGPTGAAVNAVGGRIYTGDPFDRSAYFNAVPFNSVENSGISAHVNWKLNDAYELTSITSSRSQKAGFNYDTDFTSADLVPTNQNDQKIDTITQELRLAYDNKGRVRGLLGAYYFTEKVKYNQNILYGPAFRPYAGLLTGNPATFSLLEGALGIPNGTFFRTGTGGAVFGTQDNDAYTLFGQLDFNVAEHLTLTGGVAYTDTKKKVTLTQFNNDTFSALNFVQIGFAQIFGALTGGQAPTPANFAAFPAQAQAADLASVRPCTATSGPVCNQLLGLYPLQFLYPIVPFGGRSSDSKLTYTARIAYEFSDNLNAYAGVSTGFKASSWNLSRDSRPLPPATPDRTPLGGAVNPYYGRYGTRLANPEESTVYELGLKGRWPRFAVNVALFQQEIKDFQSNIFVGTGFVLGNAGKQSTKGLEIETQYKFADHWQLDVSGTFLDPKYDSFPGAAGPNGPTDLTGTKPAGVNDYSVSTALTYNWTAGSYDGFVRADYLFTDKVQVVENVTAAIASREVKTLNASIGLMRNGWQLMVWGRNLNDDNYLQSAFPSVAQAGSFSGYPNQPRTYGLTVRKEF
jgi:outer membrane receptor protein involved in Fe transport